MRTTPLLAIFLGIVPLTAHAQDEPGTFKRPYIPMLGANVGVQQFLSGKTRAVFGDRVVNYAPGFGPTLSRAGWRLQPGISAFRISRDAGSDENEVFALSVGPSLRYGFVKPTYVEIVDDRPVVKVRKFMPFIDITLQAVYLDVSVRSEGYGTKRLTTGATFAVGTSIGKNALVKLSLQTIGKTGRYDFSNSGLLFGVRF